VCAPASSSAPTAAGEAAVTDDLPSPFAAACAQQTEDEAGWQQQPQPQPQQQNVHKEAAAAIAVHANSNPNQQQQQHHMQQAALVSVRGSPHPSLTTQRAATLQQQQQVFWAHHQQQQQQQVRTPLPPLLHSRTSSFPYQQQQGVLTPPPSLLQFLAGSFSLQQQQQQQQLQEPQSLQEQLAFLDSHLAKVSAALNNVEAEMGATNELLQQQQLGIKRQKLLNLRDAAMEKRTGVLHTLMQQQQQGGGSVQLAAAAAAVRLPRAPSFASAGMRDLQRSGSFMQQQQQGFANSPAAGQLQGYASSPAAAAAAAAAAGAGAAGMSPVNASLLLARTHSATFIRGNSKSSWPHSPATAAAAGQVLARSASGRVLQGKILTTDILQTLETLNCGGALWCTVHDK
jgi:hypothetical protein